MSVFKPVDSKLDFPAREGETLAFWRDHDIFHKQLALNSADTCKSEGREHRPFVFFEGPPTANGMPHPGHVLTRVIKDIFLRYKSMQGFDVQRKAGWDTHGLPVEIEVEKVLGIEGKEGIEDYGVEPFVKKCKDSVFKYSDLWTKMTERIGFWIDLDNPYVTYQQEYIESVWWLLKTFWDAGLLYHGHKIVPYCPRCGTALSSHEVGQGYKSVEDPSVFVTFKVKGEEGLSLLAWTTTPWTLLSNVALAVGADYDYDYVKVEDETLIMASGLREKCMGKIPHEVTKTVKGSELLGMEYEQLFTYGKVEKPAFRVIKGDFVGLDAGSGIVHIAPAFGEDDYRVGMENDLPVLNMVEADGTFMDAVEPWKGRFVKDCDKEIIKALRERGQVLKAEQYKHDYPFCWRCDSPLIYYARPAWYIRTTEIKDEMLKNNSKIEWLPEHIRDGRFGNFLETNIDWALSRERYWGTPLPIWTCDSCDHREAVGSIKQLREMATVDPGDVELHKPYVDNVKLKCEKCGSEMTRVSEVIDCWFDSGAMPIAQWGYPHADKSAETLKDNYPAFFITEAIDQTRGWFYSLLAIATLLKECAARQQKEVDDAANPRNSIDENLKIFADTPYPIPYRRCLVLGHVCDEKGYKMSKSKGNYLDPWEIMDENGADAMRWYFYSSNTPWSSVRFFKSAVRDAQKDFLVRLRNVQQFFTIYAEIDGFDPTANGKALSELTTRELAKYAPKLSERSLLDRWIRSKLASTTAAVRDGLDKMDILATCKALDSFVDALSNWYVRRSRDRFWKSEKDADKWNAYWTLYECLCGVSLLTAPIVPFMSEDLYQSLGATVFEGLPESVHLHKWIVPDEAAIDLEVEEKMDLIREIASLGLSARASQKLKVRTPLPELTIILADSSKQKAVEELADIISDEVNVKKVSFAENAEEYVQYEVKPNFKALGPKLGKNMKACAGALAKMDAAEIYNTVEGGGRVTVDYDGGSIELGLEELDVRLSSKEGYVASQGSKCVAVLDTTITPELEQEGMAREVVSRVQAIRKELDLPYEARIDVKIECADELCAVVEKFADYIKGETLCVELSTAFEAHGEVSECEIEKQPVKMSVKKV